MPNKAKNIEKYIISLMKGEKLNENHGTKHIDTAKLIFANIKGVVSEFGNPIKPNVVGDISYGTRNEPKTDILFDPIYKDTMRYYPYRLSIKKDSDAYLVSCNSKDDFISQFITIHNGTELLSNEMLSDLYRVSDSIKKIPNYGSFDRNYMKKDNRNVGLFIEEKFKKNKKVKGAISKHGLSLEKVNEIAIYIQSKYENDSLQREYYEYLNTHESFLQKTMRKLFTEYPDYSKKVIFEFVTGKIKFNDGIGSADCLCDVDEFYILDNYDCEYVNLMYNKFMSEDKIGRLQNVPRKTIRVRDLLGDDYDLISDSFAVADFTFKI